MPKRKSVQDILDHLDNIEMALNEKADHVMHAADSIVDLRHSVRKLQQSGKKVDVKEVLAEAGDIWTSVMETPYDPEY